MKRITLFFPLIFMGTAFCCNPAHKEATELMLRHRPEIKKTAELLNIIFTKFKEFKKIDRKIIGSLSPKPIMENSFLKHDLNSRNVFVIDEREIEPILAQKKN